jgi:MGT family glycosyltransferase
LAPINAVLNARRKQWRLSPIKTPDDSFSRLAQLCMMPLAFDFPRESLPECFHYLGPFLDCERPNGTFSWEKLDGRRLVYASFGTVLGQRRERFYSVATACADVDVQLVLSSGGNDVYLDGLPGSPIVVAHAPQLELLARAQLAITHAGLNTVLEAMHAGVPMVAVPITNDQPAVAARVRHAGLGVTIADNQLSPLRLRKAIQRVLETTEFQGRALHFRQLVKEAGGARRAAEIVEQVLQNGRPVKSGRLPDNALNQPPPPSDVRLSRSRA